MSRNRMIIPVFIPHQGCPYRCVFCNQTAISGIEEREDRRRLRVALKQYLFSQPRDRWPQRRELAFYGGTFTGLPIPRQMRFLEKAHGLLDRKWIHAIRLSTHPDMVDVDRLELLNRYEVETVELGVQSLDPEVLDLSGRSDSVVELPEKAASIRKGGFRLGIQLMLGLPGDNESKFIRSVKGVIDLAPDFVRIYPTLVVRGTELHRLFLKGDYVPWSLDRTVNSLKEALKLFQAAEIPVTRLGLHPEPSLLENRVEGPYHPALKSLVLSRLRLDETIAWIHENGLSGESLTFKVPFRQVSNYNGHHRENVIKLKTLFGLKNIRFQGDRNITGLTLSS